MQDKVLKNFVFLKSIALVLYEVYISITSAMVFERDKKAHTSHGILRHGAAEVTVYELTRIKSSSVLYLLERESVGLPILAGLAEKLFPFRKPDAANQFEPHHIAKVLEVHMTQAIVPQLQGIHTRCVGFTLCFDSEVHSKQLVSLLHPPQLQAFRPQKFLLCCR